MIAEDVYVWLAGPRRPVSDVKGAEIFLTYLLTCVITASTCDRGLISFTMKLAVSLSVRAKKQRL